MKRSALHVVIAALALGLHCNTTVSVVPPPQASLTVEPCTLPDCPPDGVVVTVGGLARSGALVSVQNVSRTLPDGQGYVASTRATTFADVSAGRADAAGLYEVTLAPRPQDGGVPVVSRRGDLVRVWQILDDHERIERSNPIDQTLTVP